MKREKRGENIRGMDGRMGKGVGRGERPWGGGGRASN